MSNFSLRRLLDARCSDHDGQTARHVLQDWAGDLNIEDGEKFGAVMVLPLPFAKLLSVGYWSWTGLPWLEKREAAGNGCSTVPGLFAGLPRAPESVFDAAEEAIVDAKKWSERFQAIADVMRSMRHERGPEMEAAFDNSVVGHIQWLQDHDPDVEEF